MTRRFRMQEFVTRPPIPIESKLLKNVDSGNTVELDTITFFITTKRDKTVSCKKDVSAQKSLRTSRKKNSLFDGFTKIQIAARLTSATLIAALQFTSYRSDGTKLGKYLYSSV